MTANGPPSGQLFSTCPVSPRLRSSAIRSACGL